MRIDIVADYNVPADEFKDLIKAFPTGRYLQSGKSKWFRVEIDTEEGRIELTWFQVWE